jgi:hypothetical protein
MFTRFLCFPLLVFARMWHQKKKKFFFFFFFLGGGGGLRKKQTGRSWQSWEKRIKCKSILDKYIVK